MNVLCSKLHLKRRKTTVRYLAVVYTWDLWSNICSLTYFILYLVKLMSKHLYILENKDRYASMHNYFSKFHQHVLNVLFCWSGRARLSSVGKLQARHLPSGIRLSFHACFLNPYLNTLLDYVYLLNKHIYPLCNC